MRSYTNSDLIADLKKFFLIPLSSLVVFVLAVFFGGKNTLSCGETSCNIYEYKYTTRESILLESFNESEIDYFGVKYYYTSPHSSNGRSHSYSSGSTTIHPVVHLKDGRKIVLSMIFLDPKNSEYNIDFNFLRNKNIKNGILYKK